MGIVDLPNGNSCGVQGEIMNIHTRFLYMLTLLAMSYSVHACELLQGQLHGTSFFTPRSQSTDAARDLVGWHRFWHQWDTEGFYGTAALTTEFTRSFRPHRLAEYFFGSDELTISGSDVGNRADQELLADYFGLSQEFSSNVFFKPVIQNFIADVGWFFGYGNWYWYTHIPIAWQSTNWHLFEVVENSGRDTLYPAGYMGADTIMAPYASWSSAMQGGRSFGDVQALKFGKIACGHLSKAGVAEIQTVLGYDLVREEIGNAGLNIRASFPTGNRPNSDFLLTPIIGNGKHWELGVGLNSQIILWEKDGNQRVDFFFYFNVTHLFKTRQFRSFDFLKNGWFSRYELLKQFDENGIYTGVTIPAINITTLPCDVEVAGQIDTVLMFSYQNRGFNFDIGYNAWIRSKEEVRLLCDNDPFATQKYGFKGIQNVINMDSSTNSTQSKATIFGDPFVTQAAVADPNPPVFIPFNSLDVESAASPLQFTNTIFWHLSYAWYTDQPNRPSPFFGWGGKVEFEGVRPKEVLPNKNTMSQWGTWLRGGVGW